MEKPHGDKPKKGGLVKANAVDTSYITIYLKEITN